MAEAKKLEELSSLDQLKEVAKRFGKKAVKDIEGEQKKPFSQIKAAGKVMERLDAVSDAPKRAFAGEVQKSGSIKKGAEAAAKQFKAGILEGKVLDDTPDFADITERDARRRGIHPELAKTGSKISGSILDVAAGALGAGEAVAGAKVAGKAAKELKAFHKAGKGLEEAGGIGRLAVESFDDKTMEKMRKMVEAQKRKGLDAEPLTRTVPESSILENKTSGDGLGSLLEGGDSKVAKIKEAIERSKPGKIDVEGKKKKIDSLLDDEFDHAESMHEEVWGDDSYLHMGEEALGEEYYARKKAFDAARSERKLLEAELKLDLSRPGRHADDVLKELDLAERKLAKRKGQTVKDSLSGRPAGSDETLTPERRKEAKSILEIAPEDFTGDGPVKRERVYDKGQRIMEKFHNDADGKRFEIPKEADQTKHPESPLRIPRQYVDKQRISGRPLREGNRTDELRDSDDEAFILEGRRALKSKGVPEAEIEEILRLKESSGDMDLEDVQKGWGLQENAADNKQVAKATKLGIRDAEKLSEREAEKAIDKAQPSEAQYRFVAAFKMPEAYQRDLTKEQASAFIGKIKGKLGLEPKDMKSFWMKGGRPEDILSFESRADFDAFKGRAPEDMRDLSAKASSEANDLKIKAEKERLNAKPAVEEKKAVGDAGKKDKSKAPKK